MKLRETVRNEGESVKPAMEVAASADEFGGIMALVEIRAIMGDAKGRLMQNDLVERVREMRNLFDDLKEFAAALKGEWELKKEAPAGNAEEYADLESTLRRALEFPPPHSSEWGALIGIERGLRALGFYLARGIFRGPGEELPTLEILRADCPEWEGVWSTSDDSENAVAVLLVAEAINRWAEFQRDFNAEISGGA